MEESRHNALRDSARGAWQSRPSCRKTLGSDEVALEPVAQDALLASAAEAEATRVRIRLPG